MYDIVTFGEAMLRLSPPDFKRLEQATSFDVCVGGGELNVAVAAARMGKKAAWISKLPDGPTGRLIGNKAREWGVCTDHIVWSKEGRAGIYFMEFGAAPRASSVLYDRANSSISLIKGREVDWNSIFEGVKVFHVSGITPALSKSAADVTFEAVRAAKRKGALVSYDLNYRVKLWTEEEAQKCQEPMMEFVDILISTEEDTNRVFKISAPTYNEVAEQLAKKFSFKAVAITLRDTPSVWKNTWTAIAYADGKFYADKTYDVEIVDRVGSGDSFTAGFLIGYLEQGVEYGLKLGNALAALKHSIPGDLPIVTRDEVENVMKKGGLRISR
ncbi:MAG TPA: sugar kinase [Planctomycetota bacterium]|nr:sugar kinase [Planctomycetota bacterium]